MDAGYVGFSTDALPFHYLANDPNRQKKIPTQWTTHEELGRLVEVLRRHDRVWQATPPKDSPPETIRTFLHARGRGKQRPVRLTAVAALDVASNRGLLRLAKVLSRVMNSTAVGGHFRMQALAAPFKVWGDGPITPQFEEIEPLRRLNEPDLEDVAARRAILEDPAWQAWFRQVWTEGKDGRGVAGLKRRLKLEDFTITRDLDDMTVDGTDAVAAWDGDTLGAVLRRADAWQRTGEGARDDAGAGRLRGHADAGRRRGHLPDPRPAPLRHRPALVHGVGQPGPGRRPGRAVRPPVPARVQRQRGAPDQHGLLRRQPAGPAPGPARRAGPGRLARAAADEGPGRLLPARRGHARRRAPAPTWP